METTEEKRSRHQFAQRMDIEDQDIIIQGSNPTRLSRKQVSHLYKHLSISRFIQIYFNKSRAQV